MFKLLVLRKPVQTNSKEMTSAVLLKQVLLSNKHYKDVDQTLIFRKTQVWLLKFHTGTLSATKILSKLSKRRSPVGANWFVKVKNSGFQLPLLDSHGAGMITTVCVNLNHNKVPLIKTFVTVNVKALLFRCCQCLYKGKWKKLPVYKTRIIQ